MNRSNGRKIAERLMLLEDFFIKNADKTHAVSMEAIRRYYLDNGIEGENRQGDGSFVSGRTKTKEPSLGLTGTRSCRSPCRAGTPPWRSRARRLRLASSLGDRKCASNGSGDPPEPPGRARYHLPPGMKRHQPGQG